MERERPLRLSQQIKLSVDFRWNNFSVYEREKRVEEKKPAAAAPIQNYICEPVKYGERGGVWGAEEECELYFIGKGLYNTKK